MENSPFEKIADSLKYIDAILASIAGIISLIHQFLPKAKVKLSDIFRHLFAGWFRRLAVLGCVISIGLYPFLQSPIQRLAILVLAAICIIFVSAILIGPARKTLFPRPSSPARMARFDSKKVIVGGRNSWNKIFSAN